MSEKNKNILRQANEAVEGGDYEGFLLHCTEETTWEFVGDQTLRGKEAVRQYMKSVYIEPPVLTVEHMISEGDSLTALGEIRIKDESGNVEHSAYCDVWRIKDGKLDQLKAYVVEVK